MTSHVVWLILLLLQCQITGSRFAGTNRTVSIGNPAVSSPLHKFLAVNESIVQIDIDAEYEFIMDPNTGAHAQRDRTSSLKSNLRGRLGARQTNVETPEEVHTNGNSNTGGSGSGSSSSSAERYIVRLHEHVPHEQFERHLKDAVKFDYRRRLDGGGGRGGVSQMLYARDIDAAVDDLVKIHHRYTHVFHGAAVSGVSRDMLENVYGVWNVHEDTEKHLGVSWNIDRIDQVSLPLSDSYTFSYTGAGTDIYVIDTGLDTTHQEFDTVELGAWYSRTVANIFDAVNTGPLSANNDDNSHGTHCAGIAAGRSVGAAPGANVYGLKVLDASGSGSTSNVIAAMDEVKRLHIATPGKLSVVSMSLGGQCGGGDTKCDSFNDPTMVAVISLVNVGIVVVAAAGNDYANSCFSSPGAAASAIGVAATDSSDKFASFSNYGECVDILAPGVDIQSACSQLYPECASSKYYYMQKSGTSMAAPLVAGVAAQLLEKHPTATPADVLQFMLCSASANKITYDCGQSYLADVPNFDEATKNLLVRVPLFDEDFSTCNIGEGCLDACSGHGVCMLNIKTSVSIDKSCKCFGGYYTENCAVMEEERPARSCENTKTWFKMYSWGSVGWGGAYYVIKDSVTGLVVDNAFDGIYSGAYSGIRYHCLADGCYDVVTTVGPSESASYSIGWNMNGVIGGTPWNQTYCVTSPDASNTPVFTLQCNAGEIVDLVLKDSYGDGWQGLAYRIYHQTLSKYTHGGYLPYDNNSEMTTKICLAWGCSQLSMVGTDEFPAEVSWTFNGIAGTASSSATVCVYPAGPTNTPTFAPTPAPSWLPTQRPTKLPTPAPSRTPTQAPTLAPTPRPSVSYRPTAWPTVQPSLAPSAALETAAPTFKVVSISIQLKVDHLLQEADMNPDMRLVMRMAVAHVLGLPLDSISEPVFRMIDGNGGSITIASSATASAVRRMLASRPVIEIGVLLVATPQDDTAPSADGGPSLFEKNCIDTVTSDVGLAVTSGAMQQAYLQQGLILAAQSGQSADAIVENVIFMIDKPVVTDLTPTRQPTAAPADVSAAGKKALPIAAIIGGVVAAVVLLAFIIKFLHMKWSSKLPSDPAGDFSSIKNAEEAVAVVAVAAVAADSMQGVHTVVSLPNQSVLPDSQVEGRDLLENQLVFPDL